MPSGLSQAVPGGQHLGLRLEQVHTDAGPVHGYNLNSFPTVATPAGMMNQTRDAANFNAL